MAADHSSPLFDLTDRVVIVTGGAVGIGKIYSQRLAELGAHVLIADIAAEAGDALAKAIVAGGGSAVAVATDIADPEAAEAMAQAALKAFGKIDALVNNASLMSTLPRRSWLEIPLEEWDRVMQVNLRGLFLCCRAVVPHMQARKKGKIVNIASTRVFEGTPNRLHYTTSKGGVLAFTRALAREVGEDNITVNCIAPGLTLSETQLASSSQSYLANSYDQGRAFVRPQVPADLVGALLFLLTDASDFMTGQTLVVDGGRVMH
jgi:3-oxoacyl-[acyl-carrier protein] reductase